MKEAVLRLLEDAQGELLSGAEIGRRLRISRSAVWKAIGALKDEGVRIESVPNRGYRLSPDNDRLSESAIRRHLRCRMLGRQIEILKTVGSTNDALKARAQEGVQEGLVILAEQQTAGRGRQGRRFCSPAHRGVYLSVLTRPRVPIAALSLLTIAAAVAAARAVENVTGLSPDVKWVNDLYCEGRKLAGILTEASVEGETGLAESVVTGIGLNTSTQAEEFDSGLAQTACSIGAFTGTAPDRNRLAAEILNELESCYALLGTPQQARLLEEYRRRLFIRGREVRVTAPDASFPALVLDVDDMGRLLVRDHTGAVRALSGGEVSLRISEADEEPRAENTEGNENR